MNGKTYNLIDYLDIDKRLLVWQEYGKIIRKLIDLDKLDKDTDTIDIIFPDTLSMVSPSFFLGMFEDSFILLGKEKFLKKYNIVCTLFIKESLYSAINRVIK
ncbi:hypothetical protein Goe21_01930 [Bacillus phage vB_BsuM-Goe21]|nr:hypothetical protein Goe21_01930 [Bacillus phage vB_BsuM-Goe21]